MSKLGSPKTTKYSIGTAEVRIGPLSLANKLTQAHSIGLLDTVTVEITQESVDLMGGFPQVPVDTAVISQTSAVTATLREYSQRNLKVMMGEAVGDFVADVNSLIVTTELAGSIDFDVTAGQGSKFATGDMVVIYPDSRAEEVSVVRVLSVSVDTVTLDAGTPLLFDYDGTGDTINIFKAAEVAVGAIEETNYFAVEVIQLQRGTGRPVGFNFWKGAISTGMSMGNNATDFASTDLAIKLLEPASIEYGAGADLEHLANIIPSNPIGMYFGGGDS